MENEVQTIPSVTLRSKYLLFATFGLMAILGSVFVGIQIGKNQISDFQLQKTQSEPQNQVDNIVQGPPTQPNEPEIPDELINPTEYSNPVFGISFKYPRSWVVVPDNENLIVCPNDYTTNQANARECFTISKETRSFAKYVSDLEQIVGFPIDVQASNIRHSNGIRIYHFFSEGGKDEEGFSISYILGRTPKNINFVVTSSTAWNDYGYHLERYILDTIQHIKSD